MSGQSPDPRRLQRFMWVLAFLYVAEGIAQVGGLINQPLKLHLIKDLAWSSTEIQDLLNIAMIPWFMKPVFGIVCDYLPIFGSRYRIYLLVANVAAALGYLWVMEMTDPLQLEIGLTLTAVGMASVSTVSGAMLVANGKKSGQSGKFVSQQWLWFWIANIAAAFVGGQLSERFKDAPSTAIHTAALIIAGSLFAVFLVCYFLVEEDKASVNWGGAKTSLKALGTAFTSKTLWVVGGVVFVYYCGPALMGTPFDVYVQKHGFSQTVIGYMNMAGGVGHVIGAFAYAWLSRRLSFKQLVYWSCALGAIAQASFALLIDPWTAVAVNLVAGFCGMLAVCALLTLAAESCPEGSEGFTYAVLNSIRNAATPIAGWIGSYMFDNMFSQQLVWIALLSGLVTAAGILLLPKLDFGKHGSPPSGPSGPNNTT